MKKGTAVGRPWLLMQGEDGTLGEVGVDAKDLRGLEKWIQEHGHAGRRYFIARLYRVVVPTEQTTTKIRLVDAEKEVAE